MIPILMYHQVAEIPRNLDPLGLAVPPTRFEHQMNYLAQNGYRCLTLSDAVGYYQKGERAPARSFVLTFDDGFQDVHSAVLPILEKLGFTATVFLVAGCLGSSSNWWGLDGARSGTLLTRPEAQDLARRGYMLGSHTLNHPFLHTVDDQTAYDEIRLSKLVLEELFDTQIDFFSYPYSDSTPRLEKLVESAGYTAACAGNMGPWSLFHLWRIPCYRDDNALTFALKAGGWYDKKTALRESAPGQLLRRSVRTIRRRLKPRRQKPQEAQTQDLVRQL